MKVSVITVSYNAKSAIEDTIKSVINQKYTDFEYIIVDGNSNDGTVDIIKKYDKSISKWVSEPDSGIYNAMNKGVRMATGEYCIFMNAGDVFANPLVLKQVSLFLDDDFDVLTGCEIATIDGKPLEYNQPIPKVTKKHFYLTSISHQASFIKRSLLLSCPYDEKLKLVSDWKFWLQTIVFGDATYRAIDVDVCIFNHDGLTFSSTTKEIGKKERQQVIHELFTNEDIILLSKQCDNIYYRLRRRIFAKLNRLFNYQTITKKIKTFRAYIKVLGLLGIPIGILHGLGWGGVIEQGVIKRYLRKKYGRYIESNYEMKEKIIKNGKTPVWVCWWQGEKMMPLVPKLCIKRLRENIGNKSEVVFIDKDNFSNYVDIPEYIIEKLRCGDLSITNFSDILRFALLSQYGGVWIDSTCYTASTIPDVSKYEFYSSKKEYINDNTYISKYRWASYLIGGKERRIFSIMYHLFMEYTKREKYFVDYLLLDYFLDLIYDYDYESRKVIANMAYINSDILEMSPNLNEEYLNMNKFKGVFYKLSWKQKYYPYNVDTKKMTIWGKIINEL